MSFSVSWKRSSSVFSAIGSTPCFAFYALPRTCKRLVHVNVPAQRPPKAKCPDAAIGCEPLPLLSTVRDVLKDTPPAITPSACHFPHAEFANKIEGSSGSHIDMPCDHIHRYDRTRKDEFDHAGQLAVRAP